MLPNPAALWPWDDGQLEGVELFELSGAMGLLGTLLTPGL